MRSVYRAVTIVAGIAMGWTAQAQMSANPPEIAEGVRAFGDKLGPDVVKGVTALYRPLHAAVSKDGVAVTKDIAYGEGERQKLDLYLPTNAPTGAKAPILLFAHGGGFVRGDKHDVAHFGYYFAQRGIVTVLMNYRFAPQAWRRCRKGGGVVAQQRLRAFRRHSIPLRVRQFRRCNPCLHLWHHHVGEAAR